MNILIPLAGKDPEFEKVNLFKPLIDIRGAPLIVRCTRRHLSIFDSKKNQIIFIVLDEHEQKFQASSKLESLYPGSRTITIPKLTEGAASTALLAKDLINSDEDLLIYLADIDFEADLGPAIERCKSNGFGGFLACFSSFNPKYSYAIVDKDGFVERVAEKEVISNNASAGFYYFTHGSDFVIAAQQMIAKKLIVRGLFYICPVYNELIQMKKKIFIENVRFLGGLGNLAEIEGFKKTLP